MGDYKMKSLVDKPLTEMQKQARQAKKDDEEGVEEDLLYPGSYKR